MTTMNNHTKETCKTAGDKHMLRSMAIVMATSIIALSYVMASALTLPYTTEASAGPCENAGVLENIEKTEDQLKETNLLKGHIEICGRIISLEDIVVC